MEARRAQKGRVRVQKCDRGHTNQAKWNSRPNEPDELSEPDEAEKVSASAARTPSTSIHAGG
eukprot:719655-Karenia_brevis.AAC.1